MKKGIVNKFLYTLLPLLCFPFSTSGNTICVMGTGYVGLVTGTTLAQLGNIVTCVDIDQNKINQLNQGNVPIFEPKLPELITQNVQNNRLFFSTNIEQAILAADILFIAVGTPSKHVRHPYLELEADLTAVENAIDTIAQNLNHYKTVVMKCTVPIGTCQNLHQRLLDHGIAASQFELVSNPEFLKEGAAVEDSFNPDRIVLGTLSGKQNQVMNELYAAFIEQRVPIVSTDLNTAEAIKYASNSFLALKLSYINELANLFDVCGVHTATVTYAMGLDQRISKYFMKPGPGFGGSCFPKDTLALAHTSLHHDRPLYTIQALLYINEKQKEIPVKYIKKLLDENLENKTIAVLGVAFKAHTDDIRYSPAIETIDSLLSQGAAIKIYDPHAMTNMKAIYPNLTYCLDSYDALAGADGAIILTEWPEFQLLNLEKAGGIMKKKIMVDTRNILDKKELKQNGFSYYTIGNGSSFN